MTVPTRRRFLLGVGFSLVASRAWAGEFAYRGWRFDTAGARGPLSDALVRSLRAQVDIVESVELKPEIRTFFHGVPLEIVPTTPRGPGAYSFETRRMYLSMAIDPPQNPVFLHELLHAYHQQKLPGGLANPTVIGFFERARGSGAFRPRSYMLTNPAEFFAMCASVVLWGRAARPPSTRENVRAHLPNFYRWIVAEFTPSGVL